MAVLQSTIPKEMLKKISQDEWESEIRRTGPSDMTAISKQIYNF